jgi:hypothetical protein
MKPGTSKGNHLTHKARKHLNVIKEEARRRRNTSNASRREEQKQLVNIQTTQ